MARRGSVFAFAFVLLLLAGPLFAFVPPASAQQENVVLVFPDHDSGSTLTRTAPDILQAESLRIRVNSGGAHTWLRARCSTGCLENPDAEFYALWRGSDVVFPRDFDEAGPNGNGRPIGAYDMPKYNGTWEITALMTTPVTRKVNVWLMNFFESPSDVARPGATYQMHARGYDSSNITLRIDHKGPDGRFVAVHGPVGLRSINTQLIYNWEVPKSEAARIRACREVALDCTSYRLVVSGGGKREDVAPFRMEPSILTPTRIAPADALAQQVQRTMNLTASYQFHYPGGMMYQGRPLTPNEIPVSSVNPGGSLRVQVVNATLNESYIIDETPMRFVPGINMWDVTWTVPKDLALGPGGTSSYQLVLPETRDSWGNRIERTVLANYTITRATITPEIVDAFPQLARTEEGRVGVEIRYHNGTRLNEKDVAAPPEGCFRRASSTLCDEEDRVAGEYQPDGTWVFKVRYPRDHADLTEYRFVLSETNDRWGNALRRAESPTFRVVEGAPRIEFRTVSQNEATQTLERGHRVSITAVVTYGDGEPYNHTVAPNKTRYLNATLIKRAITGETVDEQTFSLLETDREAGRYFGSLDLTLDEANTPLGTWTFRFDVIDDVSPPNRNLTAFHREVVGAPILLQAREQPVSVIPTGGTAKFRFSLHYEDGREVPQTNMAQRVEARVYAHDGTSHVGQPLSGRLIPTYEMGAWVLQYPVPNEFYQGRYAFVITGADRFGNPIEATATSKSWTTFAETRLRGVLTQPTSEIRRGESAVVVFDGDAGDVGPNAAGKPVLRLERWDTTRGSWVVELQNARQDGFEGNDHVGVFEVHETTTIGTYRFVLNGRDASFRPLEASSRNFTVQPTELTRAIVTPPPRQVVKGELFAFQVERQQGDQLRDSGVLYNGRPTPLQGPVLSHAGDTTNITWQVPFDAPSGNYSLVVAGFDVYGNTLIIRSPAIEALPAQLQGSLLGNPPRVVERGETVTVLFGVQYPSGIFYLAPNPPEAFVHNESGLVGRAAVERQGSTFQVSWRPPAEVGFGEYWFEISGRGASGNIFPTLRTESFRLSAGSFGRDLAADVQPRYTRGDTVEFAVAVNSHDAFVGFELQYLGPTSSISSAEDRKPLTTSSLPHDYDAATGRYLVRFPTDKTTPVGAYRFTMTGEDQQGNVIGTRSAVFLLRTIPISVHWGTFPDVTTFGEGSTLQFTFTLQYTDGSLMDDTMGRPNSAILYNNQPITDRPELTFANGVWTLTWQTPDTLLDGRYTLAVGGSDRDGNGIVNAQTPAYPFTSDIGESFSKTVPGPSPLLAALAVATLAVVLGARSGARQRRRRD